MKKITLISAGIFIFVVLWIGIFFFLNKEDSSLSKNKIIKDEIEKINDEEKIKSENSKENETKENSDIEILKKRFSLRWTIMKWDNYFENNQLILALNEYLKAYRESSKDKEITKKIAKVYFDLNRYNQAFEYYKKSEGDLNEKQKEEMLLSIIYTLDIENKTNFKDVSSQIKDLKISKDEKVYYINSMACVLNFHECKKLFWDYLEENQNVTFDKLKNIQGAIVSYKNFKGENLYYKDALIIWALFQDKLYNISAHLGKELLKDYPDYKPILLITGKWYYEIGEIENAKNFLIDYYNIDQTDTNVTYLLWDITFKLRDYLSSNIYYNSALENWFKPKIEIMRKLIYNYYVLDDKRNLIKSFEDLLKEEDATMNDFSLWIYHSILEWKSSLWYVWAQKWLEKFKWQDSYEIFYWYLWWISRENRYYKNARDFLEEWLKINPRNPLLTLNYGYLEEVEKNYVKALIYFKRTQNVNWDWEFWELAKKETQIIEKYLEKQKKEETNTWVTKN